MDYMYNINTSYNIVKDCELKMPIKSGVSLCFYIF